MKTKVAFFSRTKFIVGNGREIRFWEDTWLGDSPLALQYPSLYNIAQRKEVSVATVLGSVPLNIQFRRSVIGERWDRWLHLVRRLMEVNLSDVPYTLQWKLSRSGVFLVKSMYTDLINTGTIPRTVHIWKVKVPLKIKVFMWFVHKGVILTKDNLAKRKWEGSKRCCFCDQDETIEHLFIKCPLAKLLWRTIHVTFNITPPLTISHLFDNWLAGVEPKSAAHIRVGACALLWSLWTCRNDVAFNRQTITNFLQVIFRASTWIRTWSLLSHTDHRAHMAIGCNRWETVARDTYNRYGWRSSNRLGV